jgi:hypothetical protein
MNFINYSPLKYYLPGIKIYIKKKKGINILKMKNLDLHIHQYK